MKGSSSASLSPVEKQSQLKATSTSVLSSLGLQERKASQDYKSCIEVGWKFLRNRHKTVGLGKHEGRGEEAMTYCKGMVVYPVHILIQAILITQQCWVKLSAFNSKQFTTDTDWTQNHIHRNYFMEIKSLSSANFCLCQYSCNTYHSGL